MTSGFVKAGEGYFSPDGKTIIYQAVPKDYPFYQIYTQPLDGGDAAAGQHRPRPHDVQLFLARRQADPVFASSHLDPQPQPDRRGRAQAAGRRRRQPAAAGATSGTSIRTWTSSRPISTARTCRRLTDTPGYDAEGAYSPDGKLIAFCSDRDGDPDIYVMNADGANVRQLTNAPGYDGGPFISPDGKWVVFRSDRKKEEYPADPRDRHRRQERSRR